MNKEISTVSREYPMRPILAVGGVTFSDGKVLLAQRGKQPGYGTWTIPGGAVKVGETLREAVAREIGEECGIEVAVGEVTKILERLIPDDEGRIRFHYVIIDFVAEHTKGDLRPGSDCLAAQWVPLDELEGYNLTEAAKEAIAKANLLLAARPSVNRSDEGGEPAHARVQ